MCAVSASCSGFGTSFSDWSVSSRFTSCLRKRERRLSRAFFRVSIAVSSDFRLDSSDIVALYFFLKKSDSSL